MLKKISLFIVMILCGFVMLLLIVLARKHEYMPLVFSGIYLSPLAEYLICFIVTYFALKYIKGIKPKYIIFALGLGVLSPPIIDLSIVNFKYIQAHDIWMHLGESLIISLGIVTGWLFHKLKNRLLKWFFFILFGCMAAWWGFEGIQLFLNKVSFGTYTMKIDERIDTPLAIQNQSGEELVLQELAEDFLVVDFWYSGCGICFHKFPEVQALYDKYKNDSRVGVYSIHCRMEDQNENAGTGAYILQQEGYDIPCMSIRINDPALERFGVLSYPTILIFNKERTLIFRGNIGSAGRYLKRLAGAAPRS